MVGVIRALLRKKLLPAVISGASGGSIPAALVAVHTDEELERLITPKISGIYGMIRNQSVHIMMRRWICTCESARYCVSLILGLCILLRIRQNLVRSFTHASTALHASWRADEVHSLCRHRQGLFRGYVLHVYLQKLRLHVTVALCCVEYTFAEAFKKTKRRVNIAISLSGKKAGHGGSSQLYLLNHVSTYAYSALTLCTHFCNLITLAHRPAVYRVYTTDPT